jgi:formylglycine-generating enzyme required for sulfatase activity
MSSRYFLIAPCLMVALTANIASAQKPKHGYGPFGMKFVPLPKATFYMGWESAKEGVETVIKNGGPTDVNVKKEIEKGVKTEIMKDFEIAVHTVTQEQWQAIMGNNPSFFSRTGGGKSLVKTISDADLRQFPVEQVSWNDVREFIKKLNELEAGGGYVYRLPTEQEWEYACRGGATSEEECSCDFYFDKPTNHLSTKQANFDGKSRYSKADLGPSLGRTTKVGSYAPNKLGLYDMHGNVGQWCDGLFAPEQPNRPHRGGAYNIQAEFCSATASMLNAAWDRNPFTGFRLVRTPVEASSK